MASLASMDENDGDIMNLKPLLVGGTSCHTRFPLVLSSTGERRRQACRLAHSTLLNALNDAI